MLGRELKWDPEEGGVRRRRTGDDAHVAAEARQVFLESDHVSRRRYYVTNVDSHDRHCIDRRIDMRYHTVLIAIVLLCYRQVPRSRKRREDANPDATKLRRARTPFLIKTPGPLERLQTSPRHHEFVEIESPGGRKVKTWVVYPQVDHPATVVLLIHENRGLTDWVRSLADEVAEAGYRGCRSRFIERHGAGRRRHGRISAPRTKRSRRSTR